MGECGFAKVVLIVGYVSPYSYDDSMCFLMTIKCFNEFKNLWVWTLEMIQFSGRGYLEHVTDSRCAIFNSELVERWVPNLRLSLLGNS